MKYLGVVLVLISALFFAASSYYGKVVINTTEMTAIVTSFSRFALGAVIMSIYMIHGKKSFRPAKIKLLIIRALFNCLAVMLLSWALQYTTITNANMLNMTYPVFVILFAPFITKEKNNKHTFIYLFIIMLGTYIVSNPSFASVNAGDVIAAASAICAAIAVLFLTEARKYNDGDIVVFYVMLIGAIINLPFTFKDLAVFSLNGLIPVLLSALSGFLGQVFITWGYKYVDSATGALVSASRIIISAAIGIVFLSEPINLRIIIGIILIVSALADISGFFHKKAIR